MPTRWPGSGWRPAGRKQLPDVLDWMVDHAGPEVYLRQIDVPGVDTKFVQRYRSELGELLDVVLPAYRVDAAHPRSRFVERYRLARKPSDVRLRRLDESPLLAGGGPAELALRVADLSAMPLECAGVLVVENEVTYLALPRVHGVIAALGEGYVVTRLAPVAWMRDRPMRYWGDIDTHGLLMLDRMRAHFPALRSLLMDHDTLLAHEPHWDTERVQATSSPGHLTPDETALYRDLLEDRFGVCGSASSRSTSGSRPPRERCARNHVPSAIGSLRVCCSTLATTWPAC